MKTQDAAEVIASLRRLGASYEPEVDSEIVGLSGSEPRTDPALLNALTYRRAAGPTATNR